MAKRAVMVTFLTDAVSGKVYVKSAAPLEHRTNAWAVALSGSNSPRKVSTWNKEPVHEAKATSSKPAYWVYDFTTGWR